MLKSKQEILDSENISATRLLSIYEKFQMDQNIPEGVLQRAADRGTAIHEWIAEYLTDKEPAINPEISEWTDRFEQFVADHAGFEVKFVEQGMEIGFVKGILDAVVYYPATDTWYVLDWKNTSKFAEQKTELQLQTYGWLLSQYLSREMGQDSPHIVLRGVHLKKTGKYKAYTWEYDATKFFTLLNAYRLITGE
jgi:hypothetical protein